MSPKLKGEQARAFLKRLDEALLELASGVAHLAGEANDLLTQNLGAREGWDFHRLPDKKRWRETLATMIRKVASDYRWLSNLQQLSIDPRSGLPHAFELIELHRLNDEAQSELSKLPGYDGLLTHLTEALMMDHVPIAELSSTTTSLNAKAKRRAFLERLQQTELIDWRARGELFCEPMLNLGGESLWMIGALRFFPASSRFAMVTIAVWQDLRRTLIAENLAEELKQALSFAEESDPIFLIESLDETFETLHPVHASIASIGPYENRHQSGQQLPIAETLLAAQPEEGLLRMRLRYALAPNHEVQGRTVRQLVHRDVWADEFVVCPAAFASQLARSVLGSQLIVLEL